MNRPSTLPDYDRKESRVVYEDKHIIHVRRKDGTHAIGCKTVQGMLKLEAIAAKEIVKDWNIYRLPSGDIYLMEEVYRD